MIRIAILLASLASAQTAIPPSPVDSGQALSATNARDIDGFALGMNIRDVNRISPVENLGNDDFRTNHDGIEFDFGVTRLGRVYRIKSSQPLGSFAVTDSFLKNVRAKLVAKYGNPTVSVV